MNLSRSTLVSALVFVSRDMDVDDRLYLVHHDKYYLWRQGQSGAMPVKIFPWWQNIVLGKNIFYPNSKPKQTFPFDVNRCRQLARQCSAQSRPLNYTHHKPRWGCPNSPWKILKSSFWTKKILLIWGNIHINFHVCVDFFKSSRILLSVHWSRDHTFKILNLREQSIWLSSMTL